MATENLEGLQAQQQAEPVKMVPQHEVNALVAGVKQKFYEKGKQDKEAEIMQQQTQSSPATQSAQSAPQTSEEKLRQIAAEEAERTRQSWEADMKKRLDYEAGMKVLNDLNTKMAPAQSKFEDFQQVVKPDLSNFQQTPEVLHYANQFDNPGEILYDLAKNPSKMANIALMHRMGMGQQAFSDMKKLSDSIKVNEMAANQPKPKAPLTQVMPSTVGVGKTDDESYSTRFKGKY